MIRILLLYVVCTIGIAVPPILVQHYGLPFALIPQFWVMFAFYAILTLMLVITIAVGQGRGGGSGAQFFLAFTTFKLLACMGYALYYLNTYHINSVQFVVCFFYLYLLNTLFEIYALLSNLRLQNKT